MILFIVSAVVIPFNLAGWKHTVAEGKSFASIEFE